MNASEFLADLREVIPRVSKGRIKIFLALFAIFVFFIAISLLMIHFVPPFERYGYYGVFLANLLSSMGVIFPTPPGVALTVAVAATSNPLWAGLAAGLGGTLGELTAYSVGYGGERLLHFERFPRYQTAKKWMERYGGFAIFTFALLPLFIFDFIGIAAGALRFPVKKFLLFCYLGRLPRGLIEAYLYTWILENIVSHLPEWLNFLD